MSLDDFCSRLNVIALRYVLEFHVALFLADLWAIILRAALSADCGDKQAKWFFLLVWSIWTAENVNFLALIQESVFETKGWKGFKVSADFPAQSAQEDVSAEGKKWRIGSPLMHGVVIFYYTTFTWKLKFSTLLTLWLFYYRSNVLQLTNSICTHCSVLRQTVKVKIWCMQSSNRRSIDHKKFFKHWFLNSEAAHLLLYNVTYVVLILLHLYNYENFFFFTLISFYHKVKYI